MHFCRQSLYKDIKIFIWSSLLFMEREEFRYSPFDSETDELKKALIKAWFTQEIFDILIFDIEKQIERFERETKNLQKFFLHIENKEPQNNLLIFRKHQEINYSLLHILQTCGKNFRQLIDFLKQHYNWPKSLQKYVQDDEDIKRRSKEQREIFFRYLKAYGKYEYAYMRAWKKLIELDIAEKREMGKNRHMIETGDDIDTIIFSSKENHITTEDLPKTPYYKKRIAWARKDIINQAPPIIYDAFWNIQ